MKKLIVSSMLLFSLSSSSFGDFIPGRTRAIATSLLSCKIGCQALAGQKVVKGILFNTDGKGLSRFLIQPEHGPEIPLRISRVERNGCGMVIFAQGTGKELSFDLILNERSASRCKNQPVTTWWITLLEKTKNGNFSRIDLGGKAKYLFVTQ